MGELLEAVPALGILGNGIVHVAALLAIHIPPIVLRVPVGLREVGTNHETSLTIGVEHMAQHIATLVVAEGMTGNGEVGRTGVEHAEAVVVLRGEYHVSHAGITTDIGPLGGVEAPGAKLVGQREIPVYILLIGAGGVARDPVFIAYRPRLHNAGHSIETPMKQHAKLQVLPRTELGDHRRVVGPLVLL